MTRPPPRPQAVRTLAPQPDPPGIYASKYTPELGAAICWRVAAGESLRSMCRADASMPTEKTVWNWSRSQPQFAAWWVWARTEARRRGAAERQAREAARLAAQAARSAEGRRTAWNRGLSGYGPEVSEAILDRLSLGETLQSVCRDPHMPSVATVYNWRRAYPEFAAGYLRARDLAFEIIVSQAAEEAPWLGNERRSMRALGRIVRQAHRRCARIAPKAWADGVYEAEDAEGPRFLSSRAGPARRG